MTNVAKVLLSLPTAKPNHPMNMKTTSIITTYLARATMMLLLALTTSTGAWAKEFITDVMLVGGSQSEVKNLLKSYDSEGWKVINQDLNAGAGGDYIYLLYKTAENYSNSVSLTYVTGFYISNASGTATDAIRFNGRNYHLTPYDGGNHFKSKKGDLNSNAGGSDIHLYYTTDGFPSKEAVYQIKFSEDHYGNGVVGKNGDNSDGYDLNAGCGSSSDYIYMYISTSKSNYWNIDTSSDGTQCRILGLDTDGNKSSIKSVPAIIDGAVVTDIYTNFSNYTKLEAIYFYKDIQNTEMPKINSSPLTNVYIVDNDGKVIREDELPTSITSIPAEAFYETSIKNIKIHAGVTNIGEKAFSYCSSLASITVDSGNSVYDSRNNSNAIIGKSSNTLIAGCKSTTIPNTVKTIGENAFLGCDSLASVIIPNSVTSIGKEAFYYCTRLASVTIGNSVTSIGVNAFQNCTNLSSVIIGNSVTSIGETAFRNCSSLTSITIPNSVTTMGKCVFAYCSNLKTVTIGSGLTAIQGGTFSSCTRLTSITIPNSVTTIEDNAFENCSSLTSITIPNSVTSIGSYAFDGCTGLTSITIPNSVTTIKKSAFKNCSSLTSITIPNSVTTINVSTFENCSSLTSITIPNSVTIIANDAFKGCTGMTDVYCYANPSAFRWDDGELDDFKTGGDTRCHVFNTEDWSDFEGEVNVTFVGDLVIDLVDNTSNDTFLNTWNDRRVNITLQGRMLFVNGSWNMLCLPFGVIDKDDTDGITFSGTPFEGATVMALENTSFNNGTLTLNFVNATAIEAGKPYIIKWEPENSNEGTAIISFSNPTFYDVRINNATPTAVSSTDGAVSFVGNFSPVTLTANDRTTLYLGETNKLHYPSAARTINACRARFQLASPITTIGDVNGDKGVTVTDVTYLVDHILGIVSSNFIIANADVSGDGTITVTDVTSLVDLILFSNINIYNVVVNAGDSTISYDGGSNIPAKIPGTPN